jgi:hypothetical protein
MKRRTLLAIGGLILPLVLILGGCTQNDDNNPVASRSTEPLLISSTLPASGENNVPVTTDLKFVFNKDMNFDSVRFSCLSTTSNRPAIGNLLFDGQRTFTYDLTTNLYSGETYTATIRQGARAEDGDSLTSDYSWTFYAGPYTGTEQTPPTIISVYPDDGEILAAVTTNISATFSKPMNHSSVEDNFTTSPGLGGAFAWRGNSVIFDPSTDIPEQTYVKVTIYRGAKDADGNPIPDQYSWRFRTTESSAPTVISHTPADGETGLSAATDVTITFSEPIDTNTILGVTLVGATSGDHGYTATSSPPFESFTFNPTVNFTAGEVVTVTIPVTVTDLAGNPLAAAYTFSFTIAP